MLRELQTKYTSDKALTDTSKYLLVSVSALSEISPSVMPFKSKYTSMNSQSGSQKSEV